MTDTGAEALMHAIVRQAVTDWKRSVRSLCKDCGDKQASITQHECERFFRSAYCYSLTGIAGDEFISRLLRTQK